MGDVTAQNEQITAKFSFSLRSTAITTKTLAIDERIKCLFRQAWLVQKNPEHQQAVAQVWVTRGSDVRHQITWCLCGRTGDVRQLTPEDIS
jgi:hypothetical protein